MRKFLVILLCAASTFCAAPNAAANDGLNLAAGIVNLANSALNLIRSLLNLGK